MLPSPNEHRITLSIFERLTDEQPGIHEETPRERRSGIRDLRDSVLRHLEALLNTRRSERDIDPQFEETNNSVLAFGIEDFTSMSLASPSERERLRRSVERSIRFFETRLARVQVTLEDWDPRQVGLQFHIEAVLRVEPEPEPVTFDAILAKDARYFQVSNTGG